jgi:NADH dehydrogenase
MQRPRIVVVGAGFAGLECLRRLERTLRPEEAELVLVAPFDYLLYLPLLPQVASGVLTPQSVAVSVRRSLRRSHLLPGGVVGVDLDAKVCVVKKITGETTTLSYDRLVLTPGSVTRQFDIPGLAEYGRGMKTLAQAAFLRDHVIAQLELASISSDPEERAARCRFVVVGGGYAGVETCASLDLLTRSVLKRFPRFDPSLIKWHLFDIAPKLMPELGDRLGENAQRLLRRRGVEVGLGVSIAEAGADSVRLTDGRELATRTLIWTAGTAASPLIGTLGAETVRGRVVVGPDFALPGRHGVFALGDCAAVPDLTKEDGAMCPPTAQHAQRQGKVAAANVAASLRGRAYTDYRHHDLGLVVDLGGVDAVARPLGVELSGPAAQLVTRGYHLAAVPSGPTRFRVAANWALHAVAKDDFVRMGFLDSRAGTLGDFEHTGEYLNPEQVKEYTRSKV